MEKRQAAINRISLWRKYKDQVWPVDAGGHSRDRAESESSVTIHNIARTVRSVRTSGRFGYVSVPITSGRAKYELLLAKPYISRQELYDTLIPRNYLLGRDTVERLVSSRDYPILYPADLTPVLQKWEQADFQALWLELIGSMCTELHMCEGWEFSNGGAEEFVHAMQLKLGPPTHPELVFWNTKKNESEEIARMKNVVVYDHLGRRINLAQGRSMIADSLSWMKQNGFAAPALERCLATLDETELLLKTI